jgi:hypothetical protein
MSPSKSRTTEAAVRPVTPEQAASVYPELVLTIPPAEAGNADGMLADILNAESWEDLNAEAGKLPKAELMIGRTLKVTNLVRHESTEEGGIGYYLVIDAVDIATGEAIKWQTSAMSIMAKLAKLSQLRCYPVLVKVTKAEKATKNGRFPLDITIEGATPGTGTPGY